jgi:splicing factor 3A subunit 2
MAAEPYEIIEKIKHSFQYLIMAAEPYETIAFKIPNMEIETKRTHEGWDPVKKTYTVQVRK